MNTARGLEAWGFVVLLVAAAPGCGDEPGDGGGRAGTSGKGGAGGASGASAGKGGAAGAGRGGAPNAGKGGSTGAGAGSGGSDDGVGGGAGEPSGAGGDAGEDSGQGGSSGGSGGTAGGGTAGGAGEAGSGGESGSASTPARDPRCDSATAGELPGNGSAGDPYLICLPEQLALLDSGAYTLDRSYELGDDLDLDALDPPFATIGLDTNPFSGSFDGRSHAITGLNATLIAIVGDGGLITDLSLQGDVDASSLPTRWGLLVSTNGGTVRNAHAEGTLTVGSHVGVLAGYNEGLIEDSSSGGSITGGAHIGGLVGVNLGTVRQSFSTATVSGSARVGGLVGRQTQPGRIEESYALGDVTGGSYQGGLLGTFFGGAIVNSYALGSTVTGPDAGGLVGDLDGAASDGIERSITSSYAACTVSGTGAEGLVGAVNGDGAYEVTDSYFLDTAAGSLGAPLSSSEMQLEASFSGWDFDGVWQFEPAISSYPSLRFQR